MKLQWSLGLFAFISMTILLELAVIPRGELWQVFLALGVSGMFGIFIGTMGALVEMVLK